MDPGDFQRTLSFDGADADWTKDFGPVQEPAAAPGETAGAASSAIVRVPGPPPASQVVTIPPPPRQIQIGRWIYNLCQDHVFEIVRLGGL